MEEKDEELQTNFGATRWYIWARGDRGRPGKNRGDRGRPGGDRGDRRRPGETDTMLIIQHVARKHYPCLFLNL